MEHIQIASGPALIQPQFTLRSRREQPVKDVYNARMYEYWNSDMPGPSQNFPDLTRQAPQLDMKPINSRTVVRDYRQAQPYVPNAGSLSQNPFFQKFDVTQDPRNVARELAGAVYEYNAPRGQEASQKLLDRQIQSLNVPESLVKSTYENAIDVYSGNRPKLNDMKAVFR
jgi:hypothetical protein